MTMSPDLFLSILSMDAYNRGYNAGITGLSSSGAIGSATITFESDIAPDTDGVNAGFYAIAYDLGGTTIISYRGTDNMAYELPFVDLPLSFLGSYTQTQIALASQFFKDVNALDETTPMLLTGHSLGGALAGFVAKLKTRCRIAARHPNPGYQIPNAHGIGIDFK